MTIPPQNPFIRKLRWGSPVPPQDEALLAQLFSQTRLAASGVDLVLEGDYRTSLILILSGWACHYKQLANGARQIVSLLLPGDLCQPFGIIPQDMSHSVSAITPVVLSQVNPKELRAASRMNAAIEDALWWDLLLTRELQNERTVSLGRRSALERMAHLFCELHVRLTLVGLAAGQEYDMPLRQSQLADLLGLSAVHVNRSLQELRAQGLISLRDKRLIIHELQELKDLAQFEASYFHLRDGMDAAVLETRQEL